MIPRWLTEVEFEDPVDFVGLNAVYRIREAGDIRLAFYRLQKCRDHRAYSALKAVMQNKARNFVLALTKTVVKRALHGVHEIVSIMLTEELLEELRESIKTRRCVEGIYLIERDLFEQVVGFVVNSSQACGVICDLQTARLPDGNISEDLANPLSQSRSYFWQEDCIVDVDKKPEARVLRPPILILDDVRSSDNVGVILRTAFSLGVRSIIVTPTSLSGMGCRAARTSMGALFFFSIMVSHDLIKTIEELKMRGISVLGTSPRGTRLVGPASNVEWALLMGNEEKGSSAEVLGACSEQLVIPQSSGDSLSVSVATGICLYELLRESLASQKAPNSEEV